MLGKKTFVSAGLMGVAAAAVLVGSASAASADGCGGWGGGWEHGHHNSNWNHNRHHNKNHNRNHIRIRIFNKNLNRHEEREHDRDHGCCDKGNSSWPSIEQHVDANPKLENEQKQQQKGENEQKAENEQKGENKLKDSGNSTTANGEDSKVETGKKYVFLPYGYVGTLNGMEAPTAGTVQPAPAAPLP